MDVFDLRDRVVDDYASFVRSFVQIHDARTQQFVDAEMQSGVLWPQPLVQLNPAFEPGPTLDELIAADELHPLCGDIFRDKPDAHTDRGPIRFHRHQVEGIRAARAGRSYVLTTGTGSGKSLAYIVPIVDHVLRRGSGRGIQAIVVYPMNALANSQVGELEKFLCHGFPQGRPPVTFKRYTGQEREEEREAIVASPPDILLTNYVMLELLLTRPHERRLVESALRMRFLVFDELHTYRGRQGADVAMLIQRVKEATGAVNVLHVGTSATLAGGASWAEQQADVAAVARQFFGDSMEARDVIGETLRRATLGPARPDAEALRQRVQAGALPTSREAFLWDPMAVWLETTVGLHAELASDRLVRSQPLPLSGPAGLAAALASEIELPEPTCAAAIRDTLLAGYRFRDDHRRPVFAFRLHQFISKGERVYASPEPPAERHITLRGQQFVPGSDRQRVLLPLVFCRECGQEYYVVERDQRHGRNQFVSRELSERPDDDDVFGGYLLIGDGVWPVEPRDQLDRLPEGWTEARADGTRRVVSHRRDKVPEPVSVRPDGQVGGGVAGWLVPAPFLFCLRCNVEYDARQRSDYGKLATLGSEGRSSATTMLGLATIRRLRHDSTLDDVARKLLSFTDNRQDASLQAGHFNDFIEVALLRGALRRAVEDAGPAGLAADQLVGRVFDALGLPPVLYALNPEARFAAREEADRALRRVLEYHIYRDLKRGWRVSSPNLEQAGLLDIAYRSLDDLCGDDSVWTECHDALRTASARERTLCCKTLLDHMRRELAIRADVLDARQQEETQRLSQQQLIERWVLDGSEEQFEKSAIAWPRGRLPADRAIDRGVFVSARGGFGNFLRRTLRPDQGRLTRDDTSIVIRQIFDHLCDTGGLLVRVAQGTEADPTPGYQLNAGMMVWRRADGSRAYHDPVRVPQAPSDGLRPNPFFVGFYRSDVSDMRELEGREHTAQVTPELRVERENQFREARLPVLFCSPTMELGVDISMLNVVNMRNVPPTPANYAQRSGRAGRSGQPAFVYTYCSAYSPHDQYFFRRPERMVGGSVSTPRLDLANEDLLRAHVHAIWLASANLDLKRSLAELLVVEGDPPPLTLREPVAAALNNGAARASARQSAHRAMGAALMQLLGNSELADAWLRRVLDELPASFQQACERWRSLYRAAYDTAARQGAIVLDAARSAEDRERARRLRAEAEQQHRMLLAGDATSHQSDFYSYRYFASEGFLPGYNFPRLPLSAWLPGRRRRTGRDEYLQRPRFLAISEFGPQAIIYHEGSRFAVEKAILPVTGEEGSITRSAVQCSVCGYVHPIDDQRNPDRCERCDEPLNEYFNNLFPIRNVVARRRSRINCDEEERMRLGYEIRTGLRFAERQGRTDRQGARAVGADGRVLAEFEYGHAATLWRINLGWRRRGPDTPIGYVIDLETGRWPARQAQGEPDDDPGAGLRQRVVPYVEDRRNCLVIRVVGTQDLGVLASLQSALKVAIQTLFQLEDVELSAELLPTGQDPRLILLYESAEGGAGVLRRLVEEPRTLGEIAREALARCHFDPDSGADLRRAPRATEDCEAACYDCLLSYYNQRDHAVLDRRALCDVLLVWRDARVETSPRPETREQHLERLLRQCDSELERRWLHTVADGGYNLPSDAQFTFDNLQVRADFLYRGAGVVVFVDGPHHDRAEQQARDRSQVEALMDAGFPQVLRFHHAGDWRSVLLAYPSVFGSGWKQRQEA